MNSIVRLYESAAINSVRFHYKTPRGMEELSIDEKRIKNAARI